MYSKKVCAAIGFSANTRFAFKCFIKAKPGLTVLIIFTSSVLILAYDLRIFQIPYGVAQNLVEWNGLWDSIWCIIITMTTVGYGDVVPSTPPGRIIAIFTAMWGAFLISLMVLSVGQIFALNEKCWSSRGGSASFGSKICWTLIQPRTNLKSLGVNVTSYWH